GKVAPGVLDVVSVVFVPVLNPDGHERFGPNHRPNQRGPEEMGFRTNGARQNVNRDFMKADTAEGHAVLGLIRAHDPVLLIDLHTTDGAKFEHDISLNFAPLAPRGDQLEETAHALRDVVMPRMTALGHLPVDFYPSFVDDEDPLSGFETGEAPPRFSQFYAAARGRLGLLVETHSWRTYKERAASTYHTLQAVFEDARTKARSWREVGDAVARSETKLGGTKLTLMWKPTKQATELAFRGYAFEKRTSDLTGGTWLVYDETKPEIWKLPLYQQLEAAITVDVPRGGYIVDGGFAKQVAAVLDRHGIEYLSLGDERSSTLEAYRVTKVTFQPPYEGRTRPVIAGAWARETRTLDRGAIFVPIAQPLARLVLHLFEPSLPDALVNWGHFNAAFEQKEYMEPYMLEEQARAMLAKDPALRAKLDAAVTADPELAKPAAKLSWFYKQHPAWDERVNLVPVFRVDADPRKPPR
ncbi:MAG: peptidase M14, partial [Deltaproteobacteria bacterium]|nr:peptidase M14 [Deltaproteobacteria bacterium]